MLVLEAVLKRGEGCGRALEEFDDGWCWCDPLPFPLLDLGQPQPMHARLRLCRIMQGNESFSIGIAMGEIEATPEQNGSDAR